MNIWYSADVKGRRNMPPHSFTFSKTKCFGYTLISSLPVDNVTIFDKR